ncbi:MAG: type II secretion system protein [Kiritimatiellae bacterium]|nr:type II secretion system protein [Kiritimatiellia bacterium]
MMKKGFTIVELLMVVGIIAVLMGIVTTAASESMKASRGRRADALCTLVQSGLAVYYAQKDEWPVNFNGKGGSNQEGSNNNSDDNVYVLTGSEVRQCVKALVDEAKNGNPLIDVSGLWVSRSDGELRGNGVNRGAVGLDFMSAIRGTKQHPKKMKTAEMYFGYPDPDTGAFLRFKMTYSISADQLRVLKQR